MLHVDFGKHHNACVMKYLSRVRRERPPPTRSNDGSFRQAMTTKPGSEGGRGFLCTGADKTFGPVGLTWGVTLFFIIELLLLCILALTSSLRVVTGLLDGLKSCDV